MLKRYTILFLSLLIYNPLIARHHKAAATKPSEIDSLYFLKPLCYVSLINDGNKAEYNDSLSSLCQKFQMEVANKYAEKIKLAGTIISDDTNVQRELYNEVDFLLVNARRKRYYEDLNLSKSVLDSIMDAQGKRYALLMLDKGFVRTKKNYREQSAKATVVGLATVGNYMPVPIKEYSDVTVMIYDAKENRTAYFNYSYGQEMYSLIDHKDIESLFIHAFRGFFWPKYYKQQP